MSKALPFAAGVLLLMLVQPAAAQDLPGDDIRIGGDRVTVGAGLALVPSYAGARSSVTVPAVAVEGQISGIAFNTLGTTLYVDGVPDRGGPGWKLQAGPLVSLRPDRNGRIRQPEIAALGALRTGRELGGWAGIQRTGVVTSPYDTLSLSASWQRDLGGAHRSYVVSPSLDYSTPLSTRAYASLSLGADYVGRRFGRYYYDVAPAGAAASGLVPYAGAARPGWKDWNMSLLALHSITGNLTHGWGVFASGGYERILDPYARSPIVRSVGSPRQRSEAVGLAYTF